MAFRVGQHVECVDVSGNSPLTLGAVYVVAGLGPTPAGHPGLFLEGEIQRQHDMLPYRIPFYAKRFRPIVEKKTDISIFTAMLTGTKVDA